MHLSYSDKEAFTKINLTSDRQSSKIKASEKFDFHSLLLCAGHGTNSVGDSPTTGSYRQV